MEGGGGGGGGGVVGGGGGGAEGGDGGRVGGKMDCSCHCSFKRLLLLVGVVMVVMEA